MKSQQLHVVDDVQFRSKHDSQQAPITCSCAWQGVVAQWNEHRAEAKAGRGRRQVPKNKVPWDEVA